MYYRSIIPSIAIALLLFACSPSFSHSAAPDEILSVLSNSFKDVEIPPDAPDSSDSKPVRIQAKYRGVTYVTFTDDRAPYYAYLAVVTRLAEAMKQYGDETDALLGLRWMLKNGTVVVIWIDSNQAWRAISGIEFDDRNNDPTKLDALIKQNATHGMQTNEMPRVAIHFETLSAGDEQNYDDWWKRASRAANIRITYGKIDIVVMINGYHTLPTWVYVHGKYDEFPSWNGTKNATFDDVDDDYNFASQVLKAVEKMCDGLRSSCTSKMMTPDATCRFKPDACRGPASPCGRYWTVENQMTSVGNEKYAVYCPKKGLTFWIPCDPSDPKNRADCEERCNRHQDRSRSVTRTCTGTCDHPNGTERTELDNTDTYECCPRVRSDNPCVADKDTLERCQIYRNAGKVKDDAEARAADNKLTIGITALIFSLLLLTVFVLVIYAFVYRRWSEILGGGTEKTTGRRSHKSKSKHRRSKKKPTISVKTTPKPSFFPTPSDYPKPKFFPVIV